jgi:hypothetical protein
VAEKQFYVGPDFSRTAAGPQSMALNEYGRTLNSSITIPVLSGFRDARVPDFQGPPLCLKTYPI